MKIVWFLFAFFCTSALAELPLKLPELKTKDGKQFSDVTITQKLPDGVKLMHAGGVAKISAKQLPEDIAEQLGGFDPAAIKRAERETREQVKQQLEKVAADRVDEATWEPYTSVIARQASNIITEKDKKYLQENRHVLSVLQETCRPLIESGLVKRIQVVRWVQAVSESKIVVGMPRALVLLSWGKPSDIKRSSEGPERWIYNRGSETTHVTMEDDILTSWAD